MKKPDWKKIGDYDYTEKLDRIGWAWEFLRRNPEYRKDYEACQKGHFKDATYEPPMKSGETEKQWEARCILEEDVDPRKFTPQQTLAREWGLKSRLYDPSLNAWELIEVGTPVKFYTDVKPTIIREWDDVEFIPTEEITQNIGEEGDTSSITLIRRDRMLVLLDVTGPINPQLDLIRPHFKQAKAELAPEVKKEFTGKPQGQTFVQGIRALDGLEAGISKHEIGKVLFNVGKGANIDVKIHDCIESAKNNREFGYKAIARRRTPFLKT